MALATGSDFIHSTCNLMNLQLHSNTFSLEKAEYVIVVI